MGRGEEMLNRPKTLSLLAIVFIGIMISLPIQIMFLHGHQLDEWGLVFAKLSILNWMVMGLAGLSAWHLIKASPWLKVSVPLFVMAVLWNNWVVGQMATDFSLWSTAGASLGLVMLNGLLLHPEVRDLLLNPSRRWWLTPRRRKVQIPILINPLIGNSFKTATFDLSEGGAFIPSESAPTDEVPWTQMPDGIGPGDQLTVAIKIGTLRKIRCDAEVVRRKDAQGVYPSGLGIRFIDMNRGDRKELVRYLEGSGTEITH